MLLSCSGGEKDSSVCTHCHVWQVMALCFPFSIQGGRGLVPKPPYWPCAGARRFPLPQQLDATGNRGAWQGEEGCNPWLQVEKIDGVLGIGFYGKKHRSEGAAPVLSVRLGYARQPCLENSMCQLSPGGISLSHYSKVVNIQ